MVDPARPVIYDALLIHQQFHEVFEAGLVDRASLEAAAAMVMDYIKANKPDHDAVAVRADCCG